jgi:SAM-dependent methyltransferase
MDPADVAPDGSPVAVFRALPEGRAPGLVHGVTAPGGDVLELGCGAGRVTRPLLAHGHPVVAVDESADMLREVEGSGAEVVRADVFALDLGRRFACVLGASHLIDDPSPERRRALLDVCRRHVAADGVVILERYEPEWARAPESGYGEVGPVEIDIEVHSQSGPGAPFEATVTYRLDDQTWAQRFTAVVVEDDQLVAEAAAADLRFQRWLDDRRTWALLRPTEGEHRPRPPGAPE